MNFYKKIIFYIFLIIGFQFLKAQELPPIQNYSTVNYNAQNQNWAISQSKDKTIFIANNKGLLSYNGADWKLYNSPNETILRSVKAIDNLIYTGCYMEFGFWQKDSFGELKYTSLSKKIKDKLIDDEQFWNILKVEEWVLFQSLNRIYLYNTKNEIIKFINSESTIFKIYETKKGIFFQKKNKGLFKLVNGKEKLYLNNKQINNSRIVNVFDYDDGVLIVTQNNGFFLYDNNRVLPWSINLKNKFSSLSVYNAISLYDGGFALGTISNGLIYINNNGELQYQINQNNGLKDNTILSLFQDIDNNIWLGLDDGISLINQDSPFKIHNDFGGVLSSIYASIIYEDILYLGTNEGLFYKPLNSNEEFLLIKGTKGQVWSLNEFDNKLFCGHDIGTFIISNNKAEKIVDIQGTWNIKHINKSKNELLQGNYNGLYVLHKENNKWKLKNKIKGFDISSRYFEIMDNSIYVNHEYKGVLKLNVNDSFTEVKKITKKKIEKGLNSSLIKYNNNLYYSYRAGIFKYDLTKNEFIKDSLMSSIYNDGFISGKLISIKDSNELWGFSKKNIDQILPSKISNKFKKNTIPLINSLRKGVVGYEDVLKIKENNYLLSSSSGYININLTKLKEEDFKISISQVAKAVSNQYKAENLLDINKFSKLKSNQNNLKFSFNVPNYDKYLKTFYQYKLEGIYDSWSNWDLESDVFFKNLPSGDYHFLVRAKIGEKLSNNVAEYKFSIKKPWYETRFMIFIYILSFILFYIFMHNVYKRYYKNQQQKIAEKEIFKIKNEKLKQDFQRKSKELASSIMRVVKKNELLGDIKKQLSTLENKDKLKPVINIINKSLKQNDDWKFFQEAFDNADSDFLKNLKLIHPNLSPNDLKLCAYLRLNLSSKEIAPLFNISVSSLEIKRHRLRKKMNLPSKKNLVNYILSI